MIQVKNITKSFDDKTILHNVELHLYGNYSSDKYRDNNNQWN